MGRVCIVNQNGAAGQTDLPVGSAIALIAISVSAILDFKGDKRRFSGHKSTAMAERYNVLPEIVDTIDRPLR